jgi:hypothetical protein
MESFRREHKRRAIDRFGWTLHDEFQIDRPTWDFGDFTALAEQSISKAELYGLTTDNQVYRLAKLMLNLGNDFDLAILEVNEILNNLNIEGWVKMNKHDAWAYPEVNGSGAVYE